MAPMVHGLEAKYYGRIKFVFLDADDPKTQVIQQSLGFQYQPEFYLLDGSGKVLKKWAGPVTQDGFETTFAQYLAQ